MSCTYEWSSTNSWSRTRSTSGLEISESDASPEPVDFLSFLATAQKLQIQFLPITWEAARPGLGFGGTSKIDQALVDTQTSFAFKRIHEISKQEKTEKQIFQTLINEITILSHAVVREHPGIAQLQGICWDISPEDDKPWPVLVFEKTHFGDLYNFMRLPLGREMGFRDRLNLCIDIGTAIADMHSNRIIHGDVKPENVLIFEGEFRKYRAKVTDFGYSTRYVEAQDYRIKLPISRPWNAPEHNRLAREWAPTEAIKTDIFSFGMLCFWLLFEPYLSGSIPLTQGLDAATTIFQGSVEDTLIGIKGELTEYAQQFLSVEATLDCKQRRALQEFFNSSLSSEQQKRGQDLIDLLGYLDWNGVIDKKRPVFETDCTPDGNFEIEKSMYDLYRTDYRVRSYIAEKLFKSYQESRLFPLQVAFSYYIGFGIPRNRQQSVEVLIDNQLSLQTVDDIIKQGFGEAQTRPSATMDRLGGARYITWADLGQTYLEQGKLGEAENQILQEINDLIEVIRDDHPLVLQTKERLAEIYQTQEQWGEAERLAVEVLETRKRVQGMEHPDTIGSMNDLAATYWSRDRYEEAETLQVEVLKIRERLLGTVHKATLTAMANLASTYLRQKRWKEAEELQIKEIEVSKRLLSTEHPHVLASMAGLASTYWGQEQFKGAEELEIEVLETRKKVLGVEHRHTLMSMANLASTFRRQRMEREAEELEVEEMEIRKRVFGTDNPDTITLMNDLASTYARQKRWSEAEALGREVMEASQRVFGKDDPGTLNSMANLAFVWKNLGRGPEAVQLMENCYNQMSVILGPRHQETMSVSHVLHFWRQHQ
ncbi:TPR-like protein [Biscogniauxia mediterranea]|nr:TPR-like protein [Biscogniauxia mediterranea]